MKNLVCLFLSLSLFFMAGCSSSPKRLPNAGGGVTGDIGRTVSDQVMKCYQSGIPSRKLILETSLGKNKKTEEIRYMKSQDNSFSIFSNLSIKSVPEVAKYDSEGRTVTIASSTSNEDLKSIVLIVHVVYGYTDHIGQVIIEYANGQTEFTNISCQFEN